MAGVMIGLAWLALLDARPNSFFHPHGYCYLWQPALVGAHVTSDLLIGLSYLAISITLAYLVMRARQRQGIPFSRMFLAFGAFIIACGATHFVEVWTLWQPVFWTAADVKIVTAIASVGTAIALPPLVPRVLTLLENARLSQERGRALEQAKQDLERRVSERTAELELALVREQELRERAEAVNRMKDDFLGLVSHELRTPLNAILGWSSMLTPPSVTPDVLAKGVAAIGRNARAQAQLVEDLLDTTSVIAGKLRIAQDQVVLAPIVDEALDTIGPSARAKNLTVVCRNSLSGAYMLGDAQRIQQVIWNLLSNAVKFTPPDGLIHLSVDRAGSRVAIAVKDSGLGIERSFLPHVFERFSQADTSSTRSHNGLGLGLALVRHLVELHGGDVAVASDGPGEGSTFTVTFPLLGTRDMKPVERSEAIPDLSDLRVLVVDDDPETLEMLTTGLGRFGARVTTASTVAAARQIIKSEALDVIVSDLAMPQEDGFTLMRDLRRERIDVPAVALTAHDRSDDKARVLAAGFSQHIAKPATPLDVARAIGAVCVA
jgi:signal transduction histidine kinase